MLNTKKNSFKRNMAILACAAFISVSLPGVSHTATKPSSPKFPSPKESFSLISPVFSLGSLTLPLVPCDLGMVYNLSTNDKKPPKDPEKAKNDEKNQAYDDDGNSVSKKPANDRD